MRYIFLLIAVFNIQFFVTIAQDKRRVIVDSLVEKVSVIKDIQYNQTGRPLFLDIYYPSGFKGETKPSCIWIHGGGLTNTSLMKDYDIIRWGTCLSAINGFIAVSIDYRLLGEAPLPAAIEDCATAIRFLKANAEQYSIDTTRLGVVGESAGGYLAGFCAFAGNTALFKTKDWEDSSNRINCAVLWYPVTNYNGYYMLDYISEDDVPVMLIHGDKDKIVPIQHSYLLEEDCKNNDVPVDMVVIKDADHGFFSNVSDQELEFDLYRQNTERALTLTIDYLKGKLSY